MDFCVDFLKQLYHFQRDLLKNRSVICFSKPLIVSPVFMGIYLATLTTIISRCIVYFPYRESSGSSYIFSELLSRLLLYFQELFSLLHSSFLEDSYALVENMNSKDTMRMLIVLPNEFRSCSLFILWFAQQRQGKAMITFGDSTVSECLMETQATRC